VYAPNEREPNRVDDARLREALAVRERRRVRRDTTVSVHGEIYELEHGFLAGRIVDVVYSYLDAPIVPEVEYEGRRYPLHPVDPKKNAHRPRPPRSTTDKPTTPVVFDPSCITAPDDEEDPDAIF
jgi:putative transposase